MIQKIDDVRTVCCLQEETSKTIPVSANRLYNNQYSKIEFLAKNTSIFTLSGLREFFFLDTMWPERLNTRSDGELLAHMHKYFLASFEIMGKSVPSF